MGMYYDGTDYTTLHLPMQHVVEIEAIEIWFDWIGKTRPTLLENEDSRAQFRRRFYDYIGEDDIPIYDPSLFADFMAGASVWVNLQIEYFVDDDPGLTELRTLFGAYILDIDFD